jgi:hypothetical protein
MMATEEIRIVRAFRIAFQRYGAITFVVLLVAFAALDDITTGNEPSLALEYIAVHASAAWLLFVAVRSFALSRTHE